MSTRHSNPVWLPLAAILALPLFGGCGEPVIPPEESFDLTEIQGTVDTSLPPELQEKQQAIRDVFESLTRGIDVDTLPEYHPGLTFTETVDEFYAGGAVDLDHWKFDGAPTGNEVPVVMYFDVEAEELKEEHRVYTVTGSPGNRTISRKQ